MLQEKIPKMESQIVHTLCLQGQIEDLEPEKYSS